MNTTSNRTLKRLTARLPESWRGTVTDQKLASWLRSIPDTLPPDPGGGTFRRSFALSAEACQLVELRARKLREDPSAWLRRLIPAKLGAHSVPALPSRLPAPPVPVKSIVQPVPVIRRTARATKPYSDDQGKREFQKYIAELEGIARSGRPEAGEAQVRLAQIRKVQNAQKLVDAEPDSAVGLPSAV